MPAERTFDYDNRDRQRALYQAIYLDVYKAGVTDYDNPDLWQQLDVQIHYRARRDGPFTSQYVDFFEYVGNDARYAFQMSDFNPFAQPGTVTDPADCPDADILTSGDMVTIGASVEYYFTVNGVVLRSPYSSNFTGRFSDERARFEVCISE